MCGRVVHSRYSERPAQATAIAEDSAGPSATLSLQKSRSMDAPFRHCLVIVSLLCAAALPVRAQTEPVQAEPGTPAAEYMRADGTLDLTGAPAGAVDLAGMSVAMGAEGQLRAASEGDYVDISTGRSGPPLALVRAVL